MISCRYWIRFKFQVLPTYDNHSLQFLFKQTSLNVLYITNVIFQIIDRRFLRSCIHRNIGKHQTFVMIHEANCGEQTTIMLVFRVIWIVTWRHSDITTLTDYNIMHVGTIVITITLKRISEQKVTSRKLRMFADN